MKMKLLAMKQLKLSSRGYGTPCLPPGVSWRPLPLPWVAFSTAAPRLRWPAWQVPHSGHQHPQH